MATYQYKTWQTINLPPVNADTNFIILDHSVDSSPEEETEGIIYTGIILSGFGLQNLNEILAQYIKPYAIGFISQLQENPSAIQTFYIYYTTDNWTSYTYDELTITYDWSYELNDNEVLSNPISNLLDYRQFLVFSVRPNESPYNLLIKNDTYDIADYSLEYLYNYNYVFSIQDVQYWPGEFNFDYSFDYLIYNEIPRPGYYYNLYINDKKYSVALTCYNYCIYYLNQRGGWDSLLFEGKTIQNDRLSRLSYKKNYISQSYNFNKVDYLTTIQETWKLTTSFVDDFNSDKMINLLSTNVAYLHDLNTDKIIPINITNSNCEHKTYKNQNRKLYTYTIEVSGSQPKYRI